MRRNFSLHDRGFVAGYCDSITDLAALGTPIHVPEKILNRVSGTTGGIVGIYQRHSYMDEKRKIVDDDNVAGDLPAIAPFPDATVAPGTVTKGAKGFSSGESVALTQ